MSDRRLFYETIASEFDLLMNPYDLARRLSIVFEELLHGDLRGLRTLDLGCGTGWFSYWAVQRGALVISTDISPSLVDTTRRRAQSLVAVGDGARLPFASNSFDLVITSEMIEHLEHPALGLEEINRILVPGGRVVLTTPNRRWLWLVSLSTRMRWRPFEGYENFWGFDELEQMLVRLGMKIEIHLGFHPWPFQLAPLQKLSHLIDVNQGRGVWGKWMINQAICARKLSRLGH